MHKYSESAKKTATGDKAECIISDLITEQPTEMCDDNSCSDISYQLNKEEKICTNDFFEDVSSDSIINFDIDCHEEEVHLPPIDYQEIEETKENLEDLPINTNPVDMPKFRIHHFKNNPKAVLEFTGLEDFYKFETVYLSLGRYSVFEKIKYESKVGYGKLSYMDQMFMTLWKLRKNATDVELSVYFGIHEKQVGNICRTWIKFMAKRWSKIDLWPDKKLIQYYMPENFKKYFPDTRVIIDATEIHTQRSRNPVVQQAAFSYYKNDSTLKAVVGNSPGGLITYCSELYGGSTSDRQVVERSGLQAKCEAGDMIMADRGFTVQDIFASSDVTVKTPHFLRGKGFLPFNHIMQDRKLSSFRVHVERVIGLLKTYKILSTKLKENYVPLATDIIGVCVMLCNFKECIMEKRLQ